MMHFIKIPRHKYLNEIEMPLLKNFKGEGTYNLCKIK